MSLKKDYQLTPFGTVLDVNVCLKVFGGVFGVIFVWEKSMVSRWVFLVVGSPDCRHYSLGNVDGAKSLD
jgi:hypothetical protein